MDDIVERIMDSHNWPSVELPENLELLNEMADESFFTNTFSGMLSAILMYHQLIEALCQHLLENCHFQIQLSIYPATIQYTIPKNRMLGTYLNDLKDTLSFHKKTEFIEKITMFNAIRNDVIHKMRKNNLVDVFRSLQQGKYLFDEIYELYDEIQDNFRVIFHDFRKDVFLDEYEEKN